MADQHLQSLSGETQFCDQRSKARTTRLLSSVLRVVLDDHAENSTTFTEDRATGMTSFGTRCVKDDQFLVEPLSLSNLDSEGRDMGDVRR